MIRIFNNKYEYSTADSLGSGSFGSVYKCKRVSDGKEFALKAISKVKLLSGGEYLKEALLKEIATQSIATESKIPFYVFLEETFEDKEKIYIVLELCDRSLLAFLNSRKLNEITALELTFQIAIGLNYLHSVGICHRDIKPENILIKDCYLKIADFGFASINQTLTTHLGTKPYMSPEFFSNSVKTFTPKIDVWALNTCLYLFLTGSFFFYRPNPKEMEKLILHTNLNFNDPVFDNISNSCKDLIEKGYKKNADERLSMQEYIMHPSFHQFHKKYKKFMPQIKEIKPTNNLISNLDAMKISVIEGDNELYLRYFTNFRNNNVSLYKLSKFMEVYGISLLAAFFLVKKQIQNMLIVFINMKNKTLPTLNYFEKVKLTKEAWEKFVKGIFGSKLSALYALDIKFLIKEFQRLGKLLFECNLKPDFDLNKEHSVALHSFCNKIREKSEVLKEKIDKSDFNQIHSMLQRYIVYEQYDPSQMVIY